MRSILVVLATLTLAGSVAAQPRGGRVLEPGIVTICLSVDGSTDPALCNNSASHVNSREFFCTCPSGAALTDAPLCLTGERAPPEGLALYRVRKVAGADGSLVGDMFEGRPMCVEPRT